MARETTTGFMPAIVGMLLPYYGTDDELVPGWVISDGTIQNGYQTKNFTAGSVPMGSNLTGNSSAWTSTDSFGLSITNPGTPFALGETGSEHNHSFGESTITTNEDNGLHNHDISGYTVEIDQAWDKTTMDRKVSFNANRGGSLRYHSSSSFNINFTGEISGGEHSHSDSNFAEADIDFTVGEDYNGADTTTKHKHSIISENNISRFKSFNMRMIVWVGYS